MQTPFFTATAVTKLIKSIKIPKKYPYVYLSAFVLHRYCHLFNATGVFVVKSKTLLNTKMEVLKSTFD